MKQQRLLLDRLVAVSYIAAGALLAGCPSPKLLPLVSVPLAAGDSEAARAWARSTVPRHRTAFRFKFGYKDEGRTWGGRGVARVAPADSLRFDYTGPLGLGSGAAVVVGDSVMWADPAENFRSLIPAVAILWTALGIVRPPGVEATVERAEAPGQNIWRFVQHGDTLDYVASTDGAKRILESEWRKDGKVQARCRTEFGESAQPAIAHVTFPEVPARLDFTVVSVDTTAVFAAAIWRSRR